MRVLVACEESQAVCKAFRKLGHEAYSADLQECSGGHPEWHYEGDVFEIIDDGWDLMIAHPPCTHIACSGAAWFEEKIKDGRQAEGIELFMQFTATRIPKVCIENPVGIISTLWRTPDQIIQPYYFGDEFQKTTCLWLTGLNPLIHIQQDDLFDQKTHVGKGEFYTFPSGKRMAKWIGDLAHNGKERSKTFPGIARAMAEQWGS
jgi:hypothetical protein